MDANSPEIAATAEDPILSFRAPDLIRNEINALADQTGMSKSELLRSFVVEGLRRRNRRKLIEQPAE